MQIRELELHLQSSMRRHLDLACVRISVLENGLMQSSNEYTWKISGFSQAQRKAKSGEKTNIKSVPFYKMGYNCRLFLNPNGQGIGENTHLSLSFQIMKGEYDAILPWPFRKRVTFTLIDQQENANDRENIVKSFTTDPENKNCYARPVTENSGWGYPQFISHDKLDERRYIVDDTLFIQLKISPPQLV